MSESETHRELREQIEAQLIEKGFEFNSSHSSDEKISGPALYLKDFIDSRSTKSELQISQPDIVVSNDDGTIDIIEIEAIAKSPKYILGDLYAVIHSNFMNDEGKGVIPLPRVRHVYIIIARDIPDKGHKRQQYEHLVSSFEDANDTETKFKIFWKDRSDEMIAELGS